MSQPVEQLGRRPAFSSGKPWRARTGSSIDPWPSPVLLGRCDCHRILRLNDFLAESSPSAGTGWWFRAPCRHAEWLAGHAMPNAARGVQSDRQLGRRMALHFLTIFAGLVALGRYHCQPGALDWAPGRAN